MFAFGELLYRVVPFGLGNLARVLRLVMTLLGGEKLLLGGIQRSTRGGLGSSRLVRARGSGRHGKAGDGNLLLELEGAGPLRVAASAGGGELTPNIGETVFQSMKASAERLGGLLGGLTLLLRLLESGGARLE